MLLTVLFTSMGYFWVTVAAEEMFVLKAQENENVTLKCTAQMKPGVDYRAVRWYKEGVDPRLTGLVSRTPPGGMLRWYVDADTRISLEYPSLSLLLPPVSCSDAGVYQCYLAAPVGEQNREGRVRLIVESCLTDLDFIMEAIPPHPEPVSKDGYLLIVGAVGLLFSALLIFFLSYRNLRNTLWQKSKILEKEAYPDPNSLPESQDLLWIKTLGPPPKKSDISAL